MWTMWTFAIAGVIFRVVWIGAPRWLVVLYYVGRGLVAIFLVPTIRRDAGASVFFLLLSGGVMSAVGAVISGARRASLLAARTPTYGTGTRQCAH